VTLTREGRRRLSAATPAVRRLEAAMEADLSPERLALIKAWLVEAAQRLERLNAGGH
jgi:DNA-binding MarR family transcriptional regulator